MKFDMSEAWQEASAMIKSNREVLLVVAGIFFFLPNLVWALVMPDFRSLLMGDAEVARAAMMEFYADYWWLLAVVVIASVLGYLSLLSLLRDEARPTVGQAIGAGAAALIPAIGTYLVLWLGAFVVLTVLLVIAGVTASPLVVFLAMLIGILAIAYAGLKSALSAPVIALEKVHNPFRVLRRSWQLTKGNALRLFLFILLITIVYLVVTMVLGMLVTALTFALGDTVSTVIGALFSALASAAVAVVLVAALASAHRQLSGGSTERLSATFD